MTQRRTVFFLGLVCGLLLFLLAFGSSKKPPFVKLHQMGKLENDVWVNRGFVTQIRPGLDYDTMIVFSTGAFIEVKGAPSEIERQLEE